MPSWLCLSQGKCWILGCVPRALGFLACTVGIALLVVHLCAEPLPESCLSSPRATQPWRPTCSLALVVMRCSPLGSSVVGCGVLSLGNRCSLSVPERLRASQPLLASCFNSLSTFPSGKIEAPASPKWGFPVQGALARALARLLAGSLHLRCLLFLYFFFPPIFLP